MRLTHEQFRELAGKHCLAVTHQRQVVYEAVVRKQEKNMTIDAGRPVGDNQNSLTVGPRGPIVFEDFLLFEKMAHFNRERIPERVVHAKGSGLDFGWRSALVCA